MSRKCQLTDKTPKAGRSYTYRGIAKKNKGIGLNITGKVKRSFCPNIITKRFWLAEENRWVSLKLSASAIKTITKNGISSVVRKLRQKGQKV